MRKKNSKAEFSDERSRWLLRNFRESLARQSKISISRAFQESVEAPAPRFWVSEARATRIIMQLLKGIDLTEGMLPEKRKMYREIFRQVKIYKERHPEMAVGDIVFEIVNSPAPSSYLTPEYAYRVIKRSREQGRVPGIQPSKL